MLIERTFFYIRKICEQVYFLRSNSIEALYQFQPLFLDEIIIIIVCNYLVKCVLHSVYVSRLFDQTQTGSDASKGAIGAN